MRKIFDTTDTLIRKTYARAVALDGARHVVTVTNRELLFLTSDEYAACRRAGSGTILYSTPFPQDTAAAMALAALYVIETDAVGTWEFDTNGAYGIATGRPLPGILPLVMIEVQIGE